MFDANKRGTLQSTESMSFGANFDALLGLLRVKVVFSNLGGFHM